MSEGNIYSGVKIIHSNGRGKSGKIVVFIRPDKDCFNNSRKVTAFSVMELNNIIARTVNKWYNPITYYVINGDIIGSNSEQNALKEYWRVCRKEDIGKAFPVEPVK
jgi:hypothetical protein